MCGALWCSGVWDKGMLAYVYKGVCDKGTCALQILWQINVGQCTQENPQVGVVDVNIEALIVELCVIAVLTKCNLVHPLQFHFPTQRAKWCEWVW